MALTATIALNQSSCTIGHPVMATVTVSNSAASPVTIDSIAPRVTFTGDPVIEDASSVAIGPCIVISSNQTIPALGSAAFNFQLSAQAPSTKVDDTGTGTYDVTCVIYSSAAASNIAPASAALLTVHPVLPLF